MPTATKRRKLGVSTRHATSSRALDAFTKVSKAGAITTTKVIEKKIVISDLGFAAPTKKRKFEEDEDEDENTFLPALPQQPSTIPQTPRKPILLQSPSNTVETPTKGARSLLDQFCISKTPTKSPLGWHSSSSGIIESTPGKSNVNSAQLPAELQDLIDLHAAFLTALSIQYAHNGTSSPADLRNVYPNVARAWGKRSIDIDDIRRTLGVMNTECKKSHLSLADYGHGRICIDLAPSSGRILRPINEDILNTTFIAGLMRKWEDREDIDMKIKDFIATLPLECIRLADSFTKASPLLAKGQRRLEDLKKGITVTKLEVPKEAITKPDGTKMTLLERLRAKQLHQSTLPPPPSKEELARKAALGKIEEVASVLGVLSTSSSIGQQRISFTMSTVLEKLKDSLKTPISKVEGSICVKLLAAEIAPDWVKIMKMGKSEMIVVDRDQRLGELDIKKRVESASLR